jgi:hypothetical protein
MPPDSLVVNPVNSGLVVIDKQIACLTPQVACKDQTLNDALTDLCKLIQSLQNSISVKPLNYYNLPKPLELDSIKANIQNLLNIINGLQTSVTNATNNLNQKYVYSCNTDNLSINPCDNKCPPNNPITNVEAISFLMYRNMSLSDQICDLTRRMNDLESRICN